MAKVKSPGKRYQDDLRALKREFEVPHKEAQALYREAMKNLPPRSEMTVGGGRERILEQIRKQKEVPVDRSETNYIGLDTLVIEAAKENLTVSFELGDWYQKEPFKLRDLGRAMEIVHEVMHAGDIHFADPDELYKNYWRKLETIGVETRRGVSRRFYWPV